MSWLTNVICNYKKKFCVTDRCSIYYQRFSKRKKNNWNINIFENESQKISYLSIGHVTNNYQRLWQLNIVFQEFKLHYYEKWNSILYVRNYLELDHNQLWCRFENHWSIFCMHFVILPWPVSSWSKGSSSIQSASMLEFRIFIMCFSIKCTNFIDGLCKLFKKYIAIKQNLPFSLSSWASSRASPPRFFFFFFLPKLSKSTSSP